jgi:hypothetical protein
MLKEIRSLYPFGGTFPWPTEGGNMPAENHPGYENQQRRLKLEQEAKEKESKPQTDLKNPGN